MDAVIFIAIALVIALRAVQNSGTSGDVIEVEAEDTTRVAKLNDNFYDDPDAFMDIAHALGFPKERQ